nr:putative virulence factor [Succinivibrionaceae bacterium]
MATDKGLSRAHQALGEALSLVGRRRECFGERADRIETLACEARIAAAQGLELLGRESVTIGVFGPSQAGKSYLVSRLAAGEQGRLKTCWDGLGIDFLTHVNPPGRDNEATGLVTRFTHEAPKAPPGFPIRVSVLREIDVVKILVNSFNNDFDTRDDEVKEALNQGLAPRCEAVAGEILAQRERYFLK